MKEGDYHIAIIQFTNNHYTVSSQPKKFVNAFKEIEGQFALQYRPLSGKLKAYKISFFIFYLFHNFYLRYGTLYGVPLFCP